MAYDLKTAPEDTTLDGDALLFGADSAAATNPSVYKVSSVRNYIIGLANTWTDTQTITPGANTSALASTGYSLTGSNAQSLIDLAGTWNTTGTPTAIKLNITETGSGSNAASLLMDLQVGGISRLSVSKTGVIRSALAGTGNILLHGGFSGYGLAFDGSGGPCVALGAAGFRYRLAANLECHRDAMVVWCTEGASGPIDLRIGRRAAANLRMGEVDAAAPVAQTLSVQGVVAGTSNTAGANFTIDGSQGTGTGAGGSIIFRVAPAGSSGTSQNAFVTALTIAASGSSSLSTFAGNVTVVGQLIAGNVRFQSDRFTVGGPINGANIGNDSSYGFNSTGSGNLAPDSVLRSPSGHAGIIQVSGNTSGTAGAGLELIERTAPSAPASDRVRIYAEDDGAGKTRLMALFPTGAAQQIAIEP